MWIVGLALMVGVVSGLRTFTSIAAIAWGAKLGWIPLESTRLAFMGSATTLCVTSALAFFEWVGDKLPSMPSRTRLLPFFARIVSGTFCGVCLALAAGPHAHGVPILFFAPLAGAAGSVAGTLSGASLRAVLTQAVGKDLPVALLEDIVAIGLAVSSIFICGRL